MPLDILICIDDVETALDRCFSEDSIENSIALYIDVNVGDEVYNLVDGLGDEVDIVITRIFE